MSVAAIDWGFSGRRVAALVLRHLYLLRGSWARVVELAYWPTMQIILWGFISQHLQTNSSWVSQAFGVFLAAVLLWDVLFRGQLGVSISFLEEQWSRNLANLFVSPLKPIEFVAALLTMSTIRTLIGVGVAALLAIPLYHYSIFSLGPPLIAFFVGLMVFAWGIGLAVSGMVLRHGQGAQNLAWTAVFALAPLAGVYYPVAVLPDWLEPVAWSLPTAYVFEGMRAVMFEGVFRWDLFGWMIAFDILYLALGAAAFLGAIAHARHAGKIMNQGE